MLRMISVIVFIVTSLLFSYFFVSYVYRPCTNLCSDTFWQSKPTANEIKQELKYWRSINVAPRVGSFGRIALHTAIRNQSILGVRELLAAGANINHRAKVLTGQISRKTVIPIDAALRNKDRKMILFLLDRGSELGARFYGIGPALSKATESKDYDFIIFLLSLSNEVCTQANFDPLAAFAKRGSLEAMRSLVSKGMPIDGCGSEVRPLVEAAHATTLGPTHFLLKHGASIFDRDENGNGYLHNAARNENWEIMKFGIDAGLDVNVVNDSNEAALHVAASSLRKNEKQIKMLLEAGADVNAVSYRRRLPVLNRVTKERRDSYRTTPLLLAVQSLGDKYSQLRKNNNLINIEALCTASPKSNIKDENGYRAIDYAMKSENYQLIEVLRKCGTKLD